MKHCHHVDTWVHSIREHNLPNANTLSGQEVGPRLQRQARIKNKQMFALPLFGRHLGAYISQRWQTYGGVKEDFTGCLKDVLKVWGGLWHLNMHWQHYVAFYALHMMLWPPFRFLRCHWHSCVWYFSHLYCWQIQIVIKDSTCIPLLSTTTLLMDDCSPFHLLFPEKVINISSFNHSFIFLHLAADLVCLCCLYPFMLKGLSTKNKTTKKYLIVTNCSPISAAVALPASSDEMFRNLRSAYSRHMIL